MEKKTVLVVVDRCFVSPTTFRWTHDFPTFWRVLAECDAHMLNGTLKLRGERLDVYFKFSSACRYPHKVMGNDEKVAQLKSFARHIDRCLHGR